MEADEKGGWALKFRVTIMSNSLTGFWRYREMTVEAPERKAVEGVLRAQLGREFRKLVHCSFEKKSLQVQPDLIKS